MIQDMHRSENWAYPLFFLCLSPVLPSFQHTRQDFLTHDTVKFFKHDTVMFFVNMILPHFFKHDTARFCFFYRRRLQTEEACPMFPDDCQQ